LGIYTGLVGARFERSVCMRVCVYVYLCGWVCSAYVLASSHTSTDAHTWAQGKMEYAHIVIDRSENTPARGYGRDRKVDPVLDLWAAFYQSSFIDA
jgi:hypothetical protein